MVRRKKEITIYALFSPVGLSEITGLSLAKGLSGLYDELGAPLDPRRERIGALEKALGYKFKDVSLLYLALTHRSMPPLLEKHLSLKISHQEGLELLGDAVLSLALASALLKKKDCRSEKEASTARSAIASNENLSVRAKELGLGRLIYLAPGQKDNEKALPDTLEALIGALYIDGGLKKVKVVVGRIFRQDLSLPYELLKRKNYRAYLKNTLPGVKIASGPSHKKEGAPYHRPREGGRHEAFVYTAEGRLLGQGEGYSKKLAETRAAKKALLSLGLISPDMC